MQHDHSSTHNDMVHDHLVESHAIQTALTDRSFARTLEPDDFATGEFKILFQAIIESYDRGGNIADVGFVADRFHTKTGRDPYEWLAWMPTGFFPSMNIAPRLRELRAKRAAKSFQISGEVSSYPEQMKTAARGIERLLRPSHVGIPDLIAKIKAGVQCIPTGYAGIDKATGGLESGGVFAIAARPGMGKTTLAINIVKNILAAEKSVYFSSLEMAEERILERLMQCFWGESAERIRNHIDDLTDLPGQLIIDNPGYDINQVLRGMNANIDSDLFVIDYMNLIQIQSRENRVQQLETISGKIKQFAFENKKPVLLLAQLNRDSEKDRSNREPILSDIRGCGALEQDATVVSFLWDKAAKGQDSAAALLSGDSNSGMKEDVRWLIKKNRNGPNPVCVYMLRKGDTMQFDEDPDPTFRI